jgi:alpha-beta hydrolase superfamily lysophospholipase
LNDDRSHVKVVEDRFAADDGVTLNYRQWRSAAARGRAGQITRGAVIALHRGHEHAGRLAELAVRLAGEGWTVFAPDLRGHGLSEGERGGGTSFAALVAELDAFARHVVGHHGVAMSDCAVVGVSVGAVIAAAWVHDFAPPLRALVLVAPAFDVRLYLPLAIPALRLLNAARGGAGFVTSYVRPWMLTHDRAQAAAFANDPLIFRQISVPMLLGLHAASRRLVKDAAAITCPTLVQSAGADWVVKPRAQRRFFDNLASRNKAWRDYPGLRHDLLHETDRARVIDDIVNFVNAAWNDADSRSEALVHADERGPTHDEHRRLLAPLPWHYPRRWMFAAARLALRTVGRLSAGIRLGWRAGFDSGQMLDYVYENRPRGWTVIGRLIDRAYLNSVGWRGIRQRREHLHQALDAAIAQQARGDRPIRIVDLAAGPGRYVLEALDRHRQLDLDIRATLCDVRESEIEKASALARTVDLSHIVTHERRDAFDRSSLEHMQPRPTIAIVSGLYELFPDNAPVRDSLSGLAEAMEEHGLLIYTCQPHHPQLELIARVLPNREGQPWIMRRRTQAEMDALAAAAGFRKVRQWTGDDGLFTVALAQRVGARRDVLRAAQREAPAVVTRALSASR